MSFNGSGACEAIGSIQIDVVLMSAPSVAGEAVFHPNEAPILVKRALLNEAAQSVLLLDHTKFARRALRKQASLAEFDAVIVDEGIKTDQEMRLRDQVETVIVVSVPR